MIVILGAGLAGLSAALHLRDNYEIYEMKRKAGGAASSEEFDGFIFDLGIHVLHTRNQYVLDLFDEVMSNNLRIRARSAWIFSHGVYTKYPFQANTYGLLIPIVKECVVEFIKARYDQRRRMPRNYAEWIYYTFGKGVAEHFMIPYSKKMWITDPRKLSIDWVNPRFPKPTIEEVVEGALHIQEKEFGPNVQFRYPVHSGMQAMADAMASKVRRINFGEKAKRIILKKKKILFADGQEISYEKLVSTIPLPELVKITDGDIPTKVRAAAEKLKYVSDMVVNVGLDKEDLSAHHWVYFPEKEYPFLRISFPKNLSPTMVPEGKSSISAEIFYRGNLELNQKKVVPNVINSLVKAKVMSKNDKLIHNSISNIKYAYVLYTHDRKENTRIIHGFFKKHGIFPCGRFGEWKYLWMDDAILSGKKIADQLTTPCFKKHCQ